jgi:hypothetical protein
VSVVDTAAAVLREHGGEMPVAEMLAVIKARGTESPNGRSMLAAEANKPDGRIVRVRRGVYTARATEAPAPKSAPAGIASVTSATATRQSSLRAQLKAQDTRAVGWVSFDELVDAAYDSDLLILAGMHRRAIAAREIAQAA